MRSRLRVVTAVGLFTFTAGASVASVAGATTATTEPAAAEGGITVFAAASLTDAFTAIGEAFETANPDADVEFNFAASSDLVTQITEGAPADVFASADVRNMDTLVEAGANGGEPQTFATNTVEIIVEAGNPLGITGVADLANPDLIVVSCDPEVPIGAYTQEVFANAGVEVEIDSYEENVRAVSEKVVLGEADAGIVYVTDVIAAGDDAEGVEIPADINVIAEYPLATTAEAGDPEVAAAFVDFVLAADGQAILAEFGFGPADAAEEAPTDSMVSAPATSVASAATMIPDTTLAG